MNTRSSFPLLICLMICNLLFAQIQEVEIKPDGVVVPRLDHTTVSSPVAGQLVYDINTNSFWFHDGSTWTELKGVFERSGNLVRPDGSYDVDDFVFGRATLPTNGESVFGAFSFFDKSKGAWRGGAIGSSNWSPDSIGTYSTAFGLDVKAKGSESIAMGSSAQANGAFSTSIGWSTQANGVFSTAMGSNTKANSTGSMAMGENTQANGSTSTAMGLSTQANGINSTAMGASTRANGGNSTAMGEGTRAHGFSATVIGQYNDTVDVIQAFSVDTTRLFIIGNGNSDLERSNAMVVQRNGRVGIGENSPGELLVVGTDDIGELAGTRITIGDPTSFSGVNIGQRQDDRAFLMWTPDQDFFKIGTVEDGTLYDFTTVWHSGQVGIGINNPGHPLEMASGAHVTAGGAWTNASSKEYKENIWDLTLTQAKATLQALEPKQFNYKVDPEETYLGFIAEDVPDLVATQGRKGLSPMDLVAVLTKVVQEQQERIDELEEKVQILARMKGKKRRR